MADEKPEQIKPEDDSKKDTVRINLPPGLGRGVTATPAGPTPTVKLRPSQPGAADEEAKKETAVMGRPVATPKPKSDTSRVAVAAAKPGVPEMPRPTVKLRREEEAVPAAPAVAAPGPAAAAPAAAVAAPSGLDVGLAVASAVLSLLVLVYLVAVASS